MVDACVEQVSEWAAGATGRAAMSVGSWIAQRFIVSVVTVVSVRVEPVSMWRVVSVLVAAAIATL